MHRRPVQHDRQADRAVLEDLGGQLQARVHRAVAPAQSDVAAGREAHRLPGASGRRARSTPGVERSALSMRARKGGSSGSAMDLVADGVQLGGMPRRRRAWPAARSSAGCSTAARTCPSRPASPAGPARCGGGGRANSGTGTIGEKRTLRPHARAPGPPGTPAAPPSGRAGSARPGRSRSGARWARRPCPRPTAGCRSGRSRAGPQRRHRPPRGRPVHSRAAGPRRSATAHRGGA